MLGLDHDTFRSYLKEPVISLNPTILRFKRERCFWQTLNKPCTCRRDHSPLTGALTTAAAAYPDMLCELIAQLIELHMTRGPGPWLESNLSAEAAAPLPGYEGTD